MALMEQAVSIFLLLLLAFPRAWAQGAGPEMLRAGARKDFSSSLAESAPSRAPSKASHSPRPAFEEGSFPGEGGVEIRYLFRRGKGPAILLVHGTILAAEAQKQGAEEFFPGRPVLALYRRGYAPSGIPESAPESVGRENAADIAKAVEAARKLSGGEKVCIVAFSLGAMMLPPTEAERTLWVALVNPAASGMLGYMTPQQQALSWALKNAYEASRYWHPESRKAWIRAASGALSEDLIDLIRAQQPEGDERFADFLVERIRSRMERRAWQELIIEERLWAIFSSREMSIPSGVPVFMAASLSDGMIPAGVHDDLVARVKASAAWVEDVRWPGGHLTPVFKPDLLVDQLSRFDRKVLSSLRP